MSEMLDRIARAIGEIYDGYADPVSTPNNWARAIAATNAAIEAMEWPTLPMVDAGYAAKDDDNLSITSIWQAMLAASSVE